jgi:hypothetical protein
MREQQGPIKEQPGLVKESLPMRQFGNYDLVRRINTGGMGEVYLARQRTAFGREVALKIIRSDLAHDITARKRFLREAEVSAHLKHEHILALVEFGEEQGRLFLVTPYIEGGTLLHRLQDNPLSLTEVYQLFTALVQAVVYIHKRGVIHRDLKPSNILLDRAEGSDQVYVRLIDFGIATIQGSAASPPLTTGGTEVGTFAYMAPERLNGIAAPSNDIYSLGIILYQMLSGQPPDAEHIIPIPSPLDTVVRRCTAPRVEERFASADELLKAFKQACRILMADAQAQLAAPLLAPVTPVVTTGSRPKSSTNVTPLSGHVTTENQHEQTVAESRVLRSEVVIPARERFNREDYNAPTSFIGTGTGASGRQFPERGTPLASPPGKPRRKKGLSLFALIPLSIVLLVVIIGAMALFAFQSAVSANVTIRPQVQTVSGVFTITARPGLTGIDATTSSIPVFSLTESQTASKEGKATGRPFFCPPRICSSRVSDGDEEELGEQVRQNLRSQLKQKLNAQVQAQQGTLINEEPSFITIATSTNPPVGTTSDKVTVTLTEKGTVTYYNGGDIQKLVRQLLQKKAGASFQLVERSIQIGQPVARSAGAVTLMVPAVAVAQYQLAEADLQNIQNNIKGKTVQDAGEFIKKQQGIDPTSIVVSITYGETIPLDTGQIKIVQDSPTELPQVQLPKV